MPWEKSFDEDAVLDRAMKLFITKGYEATSMADLLEATGLNKGSLYNAFGSKKELFARAFVHYEQDKRKAGLKELAALDQPVAAIIRMFDDLVAPPGSSDIAMRGCLLVNTAQDLPNHDADMERTVKEGLGDFEAFFVEQLTLAKSRGQVSKKLDIARTARGLLALVVGIRVLERGAFDQEQLASIRDQAVALLE